MDLFRMYILYCMEKLWTDFCFLFHKSSSLQFALFLQVVSFFECFDWFLHLLVYLCHLAMLLHAVDDSI